jgi:uncharacterized protein
VQERFFYDIECMKSLLWKLERPEGVSYVFGTMHTRDERAFVNLSKVYSALEATDLFAAEFDLDGADPERMISLMQLPPDQSLSALYGQRRFNSIYSRLRHYVGLDLKAMQQLIPFAIISMIDQQMLGTERQDPLDIHLWSIAREQQKKLAGLETTEEHYGVLEQMPMSLQLSQLASIAAHVPAYRRRMRRLTDLYVAGDIRQLYMNSKKGAGELRRPLLYDRNQLMSRRLEQFSREQTVFAAVGAAHLYGERGMLRLLKHAGFRISPV